MRKFTFTEIEYTMILSSIWVSIEMLKKEEKETPDPKLSQKIAQEIVQYKELQIKLKTKYNHEETNKCKDK